MRQQNINRKKTPIKHKNESVTLNYRKYKDKTSNYDNEKHEYCILLPQERFKLMD